MKRETKIEDRRLFFFACLGTGHFIMLLGAIENLIAIAGLGMMLGTLSSLALRYQEETVYNKHNYTLWIKMKSNASVIRILNGILIIIIAMAMIGPVAKMPIIIGILSILAGTAKAATKEYFVKSSCRSVYMTTKYLRSVLSERTLRILGITSERCLKIMEFKGCQHQRVVAYKP